MNKRKRTIVEGHKKNFQTLIDAIKNDQVCIMDCKLRETGEPVATICVINETAGGEIEMVPFAAFFNGNPFELLSPPNPAGGYHDDSV